MKRFWLVFVLRCCSYFFVLVIQKVVRLLRKCPSCVDTNKHHRCVSSGTTDRWRRPQTAGERKRMCADKIMGAEHIPTHCNCSAHTRARTRSYLPIPWRHQLIAALLQVERRSGGRKWLKRRTGAEDVSRRRRSCFETRTERACAVRDGGCWMCRGTFISSMTSVWKHHGGTNYSSAEMMLDVRVCDEEREILFLSQTHFLSHFQRLLIDRAVLSVVRR